MEAAAATKSTPIGRARFVHHEINSLRTTTGTSTGTSQRWIRQHSIHFQDRFFFQLSANNVAEVLHGSLLQRVLLFFDWDAFALVVQKAGGKLRWTTKREGRQEWSRPGGPIHLMIGARVPRIELPDGFGIRLGSSKISRVLYDGLTPSTVAEQ